VFHITFFHHDTTLFGTPQLEKKNSLMHIYTSFCREPFGLPNTVTRTAASPDLLLVSHGGTPKMIFHIRETPTYENVYRTETADSVEPFCRHRCGGSVTIRNARAHNSTAKYNLKYELTKTKQRGIW
jgi:hypothetical protein